MGLKVFSQQFRDSVLKMNLATPPDIVAGMGDLVGAGMLDSYKQSIGQDTVIASNNVGDPGTIVSKAAAPRQHALSRNLQTPQDVFDGIKNLSPTQTVAQQYLDGRGTDTVIRDLSVTNPGDVDTFAEVEVKKLLNKNITRNQNDPSQSDDFIFGQGYTYTTLISGIGKPTTIHDYNVSNLASVTLNPNITPEVQFNLAIQQNRYMPTERNEFEVVVNQLASTKQPYVNMTSGNFTRYQAEEYLPSEFISGSASTGTYGQLSSRTQEMLKTDTLLMNIAAMELKFNFETRVRQALERETLGRTKIDEAITNPLTAIQLLTGKTPLFERSWEITQLPGVVGKAASLIGRIAGTEVPVNVIPEDQILMPGNFGNVVPKKRDGNEILLGFTGGGQKYALNANLAFNKYTPIFSTKRNAGQYVGGMNGNPLDLSNPQKLSQDFEPNVNDLEMSKQGSVATNFAWVGKLTQVDSGIQEISSYHKYSQLFKSGSILENTQNILNNLDDATSVAKTAIDQTKTKLDDGYKIMSRGSGVLSIDVVRNDSEGGKHLYGVPGRDRKGMMNAELCRVWTKKRPYHKVTDAIRYKELIRKERNSVIDKFGNYNIFPSQLNVNEGYGRPGTGMGDAVVEAFGERRARKYMFSIENLAWRDSAHFQELPACEKGQNGGRVMWFPPYDIKFTEDSTANWTTHQFLGRPEPIYTFNNTERSGNLSFKVVVDHPSILNTLVKYELANLTDEQVDEVLASFWSGCLEYDVYELARIWGVLTDQDINFFKNVIADLDPKLTNAELESQKNAVITKQAEKTNEKVPPTSSINGHALYFENDVPFPENAWTSANFAAVTTYFADETAKNKFFTVRPFDEYFTTYTSLATTAGPTEAVVNGKIDTTKALSANALKAYLYYDDTIKGHYKNAASFAQYSKSIGQASGDNYFFNKENSSVLYGFARQKEVIEQDLKDSKYNGFAMEIKCTSFASPINADSYNKELAHRRFKSVAKWIALKVLPNTKLKGGAAITPENVNDIFSGNKAEFFKNNDEPVTIITEPGKERDNNQIKEELKKEIEVMVSDGKFFNVPYDGNTYKCYFAKGTPTSSDLEGNLEPNDRAVRRNADLVCADLSIVAARARRVDLTVTAKPITKTEATKPAEKKIELNYKKAGPSITKREVAQRLLNKLVNECDYFEYLKDSSPIVYNSLKEKLKYFLPAFHSMTPEGLNSRLTFLQQCLRPGETIKSGASSCDAVNTSFGKPPICVLRIGDFYHTKIAITNISISHEPLVWDLNPEGIGAQPMLADVNMSFKFIGGSGLRKHVDQLQNALTSNFYANADMYDERTFANTDAYERSLINLESDFFDNNTLDIEKIVDLEEIKPQMSDPAGEQAAMVGRIVETMEPKLAGGPYYIDKFAPPQAWMGSTVYSPSSLVSYGGYIFERLNVDLGSTDAPTNTTIWKEIERENYGEEAYLKEYGRNYVQQYKVDYSDVFKGTYASYLESLGVYVGIYNEFLKTNASPLMMNFLMKQHYGSDPTGNTVSGVKAGIATGVTSEAIFKNEASERNYKPYFEIGDQKVTDPEIMKLHLYPQDKFYKMTDGVALDYPTSKVNPGSFQGIYLKDKLTVFDHTNTKTYMAYHVATLTQKIGHDMTKFLSQNETLFNSYMRDFYAYDKVSFRQFLKSKLADYDANMQSYFETSSAGVRTLVDKLTKTANQFHKLSLVLNGNDGLADSYTEVVPNGTLVKDITKIFNYNPYEHFPIVSYETDSDGGVEKGKVRTYTIGEIKNIVSNRNATPEAYKKFVRLGNGTYFFKQMMKSNIDFAEVSTANDLSTTNLPYLKPLDEGVAYSDTDVTVNYRTGTGLTVGLGTGTTTEAYTETGNKPKTTFEKLNFEMLEFSNKTLSVMVNDTIADNTTTFDTFIKGVGEVKAHLRLILKDNYGMATEDINDILANMVGDKELPAFTFASTPTLPQDMQTMLEYLDNTMHFSFVFTQEFVDNFNKVTNSVPLPNEVVGEIVLINYYDELLLLGFYESLLVQGVSNLAEEFKKALNVSKVIPKGANAREQKEYVKAMTEKRTKAAVALAEELNIFVQKAKADLDIIYRINQQKVEDFSTNARKVLFGEDSTKTLAGENYEALAEKLMKKVDGSEYTLVMRKTTSVDARTKTLINKLYNV